MSKVKPGEVRNPNGRPVGSKNKISIVSMVTAIEKETKMPFERMVANTLQKLYTDFYFKDINTKEFLMFAQYVMSRIVEKMPDEVIYKNADLPDEELDKKIKMLMDSKPDAE